MKQIFFIGLGLMVPLVLLAGVLYAVWHATRSLYDDWRLGKELTQLRTDTRARRTERYEENQCRLDNGCDHDFTTREFGFPTGVCPKCGLAQKKPSGDCDHAWRRGEEDYPSSVCAKCGKTYRPSDAEHLAR